METRLATTIRIDRAPAGRTTADVECPWCGVVTQVRVWSLAGSGKRCDCGALLHGDVIGSPAATRCSSSGPSAATSSKGEPFTGSIHVLSRSILACSGMRLT